LPALTKAVVTGLDTDLLGISNVNLQMLTEGYAGVLYGASRFDTTINIMLSVVKASDLVLNFSAESGASVVPYLENSNDFIQGFKIVVYSIQLSHATAYSYDNVEDTLIVKDDAGEVLAKYKVYKLFYS
jgi:hypothetical protein